MDKLHEGGLCPVMTMEHLDLLTSEIGGFVFVEAAVNEWQGAKLLQDLWDIGAATDIRSRYLRNPIESADMKQRFKDRMSTPRRILITAKVTAFGRLLMELDV